MDHLFIEYEIDSNKLRIVCSWGDDENTTERQLMGMTGLDRKEECTEFTKMTN